MSPQFVDFTGDGKLDVVAGTFDGSPHVAVGVDGGWKEPTHILDGGGQRIVLNQFWNFDTKKWDETKRCDPKVAKLPKGHLTSAYAWDQDADGDLDLLLGDYDGGWVFLRKNLGTADAPKFAEKNEPVLAGGQPISVGKVATMRLLDWDGDGLPDLVIGTSGDSYGDGPGGDVRLFRNTGKRGAPEFTAAGELVAKSPKSKGGEPTRPDTGLHMDAADIDGDGDLDLIVGGYSHNTGQRGAFVWLYENRGKAAAAGASR